MSRCNQKSEEFWLRLPIIKTVESWLRLLIIKIIWNSAYDCCSRNTRKFLIKERSQTRSFRPSGGGLRQNLTGPDRGKRRITTVQGVHITRNDFARDPFSLSATVRWSWSFLAKARPFITLRKFVAVYHRSFDTHFTAKLVKFEL